jgi:hypothetical protein
MMYGLNNVLNALLPYTKNDKYKKHNPKKTFRKLHKL